MNTHNKKGLPRADQRGALRDQGGDGGADGGGRRLRHRPHDDTNDHEIDNDIDNDNDNDSDNSHSNDNSSSDSSNHEIDGTNNDHNSDDIDRCRLRHRPAAWCAAAKVMSFEIRGAKICSDPVSADPVCPLPTCGIVRPQDAGRGAAAWCALLSAAPRRGGASSAAGLQGGCSAHGLQMFVVVLFVILWCVPTFVGRTSFYLLLHGAWPADVALPPRRLLAAVGAHDAHHPGVAPPARAGPCDGLPA